MTEERLVAAEQSKGDTLDVSLRPQTLDDFVVLFLLFGGISEREELKASQVVHT